MVDEAQECTRRSRLKNIEEPGMTTFEETGSRPQLKEKLRPRRMIGSVHVLFAANVAAVEVRRIAEIRLYGAVF
ncbi:unnamed protein product [Gongylonema pulchrum]|uniref:Uncharacterized protein n=1 Tax=Gongylonema pulchrum TaxID=637853 RepID=A0A183DRH7_9BILA|nr:unnamed protein product [Gongylonema pulchrum]